MMNTQILGRLSPLLRSHSPLSSVFYTRTSLRFSRSLYPTHLTSNPLADPLCPSPSNPSIWIFYSPFTHTPSFRRYEDECNRDPDSPPKLFVVQPRVRPEKILQAKLNEALNLANSLEVQRDGYFKTEFSEKKLPPHVVVHDPLSRSRKGRADKYFGPGTVENIKCHINALETDDKLDAVFVNAVLTGTQQRNLERAWDKPVLDRIGLIIMIFNAHAYTKEAKLQAELAALMYQKTRLVRIRGPDGRYTFGALGEAEVERGSMGRGFLSGAGETELELQRRRISERRLRLLAEIDEVRRTRALQRNARKRRGGLDGQELPTVAIVGYTNAGKSTLVSVLSDSDLYSDDRLFATVDPRLRSVTLPSGKIVLLSDTVGFISDLPVQLVEAFHATLEEVVEAELLVHVVDSSAPNLDEQRCAVLQVLKQIGVSEEKIQNMIEVWNKIDIQDDQDSDEYLYNGEDTEAENFSHVEDDTASELSLGKHGGGSISRVEDDDMASELSPRESEEGNNRNSNGRWLGDEEIEDQQSDYSDGWLAPGDSEVCSEDWVYSSMGWAFDEQTQEPFSELMSGKDSDSQSKPTPPVKTSAITGVGLQELLELIDEKIGAIVENRDSNRKVERFEFDRKWRPPRPRDAAMVVEK